MIESNYISFRDPVARVIKKGKIFYRYIFFEYKSEFDHFVNSGLYNELIKKNLLISHEDITEVHGISEVYKVLLPRQISFQSYPYEWSYRQWRKAILAFLTINQIALKYGMILKDATPYNFFIDSDKAILFDTTSFSFFKEGQQWLAYKQFCESFLSPLVLMYYNGPKWSKLSMAQLSGIPLDFVSRQLPMKSWLSLTVLLHIHLHAKYIQNQSVKNDREKNFKGFSLQKIAAMFSLIKGTIYSWEYPFFYRSFWNSYYEREIETESYLNSKESIIIDWLKLIKPASVLDLGSNTGKFSFIASSYSDRVIALEQDENCVDQMDNNLEVNNRSAIYPLIGDLSEPSPGLGLLNNELIPFVERANSELVLSLALIHHLFFKKDMSFKFISELFSRLSSSYLIVEYIPKEDRKVKELIEIRPSKSTDYNIDSFRSNLCNYFELLETKTLESSTRSLMLFKKKNL